MSTDFREREKNIDQLPPLHARTRTQTCCLQCAGQHCDPLSPQPELPHHTNVLQELSQKRTQTHQGTSRTENSLHAGWGDRTDRKHSTFSRWKGKEDTVV